MPRGSTVLRLPVITCVVELLRARRQDVADESAYLDLALFDDAFEIWRPARRPGSLSRCRAGKKPEVGVLREEEEEAEAGSCSKLVVFGTQYLLQWRHWPGTGSMSILVIRLHDGGKHWHPSCALQMTRAHPMTRRLHHWHSTKYESSTMT